MSRAKKSAVRCSDVEHRGPPAPAVAHGQCATCYARARRRLEGVKPHHADPPGSVEIKVLVSGDQSEQLEAIARRVGTSVRRLGGEIINRAAVAAYAEYFKATAP